MQADSYNYSDRKWQVALCAALTRSQEHEGKPGEGRVT